MTMRKPVLLLVDDNEAFRNSLKAALSREYEVKTGASRAEARTMLNPPPDTILLDLRLNDADPSNAEGLEFLRELRRDWPTIPVVMITGYGDIPTAVECMRLGAVDFIQKVADLREIKARLERALEHARLARRVAQLEQEIEPRELIGESIRMREVKEFVAAAAREGNVTVLVVGETGTGKELVARAIHACGPRREGPFVAVHIAGLPETMVESELFGHERGAYTGAHQTVAGYLERAHGGVLFLDEVDELKADIQVKLLRFLEERKITRLGGSKEIPVDIQLVSATKAPLAERVSEGRFRADLYYRLRVLEIRLPPLRERCEDIPLLAVHFFKTFGGPARGVTGIAQEAMDLLCSYDWPGNVRELRNVIEAAILKATLRQHRQVEPSDLPVEIHGAIAGPTSRAERSLLEEALARAELAEVERALAQTGGKKTEAWKLLGLNDRFALRRRVRRILQSHPQLADQFPRVREAYGGLPSKERRT
jgi:DNA-binding NtrC family response regulator